MLGYSCMQWKQTASLYGALLLALFEFSSPQNQTVRCVLEHLKSCLKDNIPVHYQYCKGLKYKPSTTYKKEKEWTLNQNPKIHQKQHMWKMITPYIGKTMSKTEDWLRTVQNPSTHNASLLGINLTSYALEFTLETCCSVSDVCGSSLYIFCISIP